MSIALSWNEVRNRAINFAREWAEASREDAEAKSFWDAFFVVFGKARRTVATFEEPVRNIKGQYGYIDLFWRGKLIVEHKSRGKDLDKAHTQAINYIQDLINEGRDTEVPRYILVSDFLRLTLHDLDEGTTLSFSLGDLYKHVRAFAFIKGEKPVRIDAEDPANIKAAEIMGDLHDTLKSGGYFGHSLERFLVRVLFCLFAEDTGIFEPNAFTSYLENHTREDGTDVGNQIHSLFEILDTPIERRQVNLDEDLSAFPYVNGELFKERLQIAAFNRSMRSALLSCTHFDWSRISPAVFGSLFQSVMEPKERRQIGGHYTSERDILKLIRSLFLDDLRKEFEAIKADRSNRRRFRLEEFQNKLASLKFLDPACGCGNFLVITYRELRALELDILKMLHINQKKLDVLGLSKLRVDQMYGIELLEFPVRIAEAALWLIDHQMNLLLSEAFGQYAVRLPLTTAPKIVCANSLRIDWREVLEPEDCSYIFGNPPFVGKKARNQDQQADMEIVFGDDRGTGVLDYVCCWYIKVAEFIQKTEIKVAFVSTNSITQGEQPGVLWSILFAKYHLKIHSGHRTFAWESEARGKAHVHVIINCFASFDTKNKHIYDYESSGDQATVTKAKNISPYLIEGNDFALMNREKPICEVPEIQFGNMPNDNGFFLLTDIEKRELIKQEPEAAQFIRPFISAKEYLHNEKRWCLWLQDASPRVLRGLPLIMERVEAVKKYRRLSKRMTTRRLAEFPTLFGEIRQPSTPYILVPRHSSENRRFIPLNYFSPHNIVADSCLFLPNAKIFHFGILSSTIHMAWVRQVCGRIKSDYRYSNKLVYNNFPWPQAVTENQKASVEKAAQLVLSVRKEFSDSALADLYDPLTMPPKLAKAHAILDKASDRCFRCEPFKSDRERVEYLFNLYEKLASPLIS